MTPSCPGAEFQDKPNANKKGDNQADIRGPAGHPFHAPLRFFRSLLYDDLPLLPASIDGEAERLLIG
jgi:hypothetical protein